MNAKLLNFAQFPLFKRYLQLCPGERCRLVRCCSDNLPNQANWNLRCTTLGYAKATKKERWIGADPLTDYT